MRTELQKARKVKNNTQQQVAEYLNMTKNAYQAIELGTRGTSEDRWLRLFEYFDKEIPLHELMKNS